MEQQIDAVDKVLSELDVSSIPKLMVWNKVDDIYLIKLFSLSSGGWIQILFWKSLNPSLVLVLHVYMCIDTDQC